MHPDDFKGKDSKLPTYEFKADLSLVRKYSMHYLCCCRLFDEHIDFSVATYKEYVNGTRMISQEKTAKKSQYFYGVHISKHDVKRAFKIAHMPYYTGVGIVQPYYFDMKQAVNIFAWAH